MTRPRADAASLRGSLARLAKQAALAGEILLAYLAARRAVARAPLTAALVRLRAAPRPAGPPRDPLTEARRLAGAVTATLALLPADTRCLARSLVLTRLLARRGIPARLVIGARTGPDFLAHAWVEHDGEPLLSPGGSSIGRLVEL
jgi:hypothetical protein